MPHRCLAVLLAYPQDMYPVGALASAIFIASESEAWNADDVGTAQSRRQRASAEMELVRLAVPKRVFTLAYEVRR